MDIQSETDSIPALYERGEFRRIVAIHDRRPDADYAPAELLFIGRSLVRAGDDPMAARDFWRSLVGRESIDQYLVALMLLRLSIELGDFASAADWCLKAEETDAARPDARIHLIGRLMEDGRDDEARQWIDGAPAAQAPALWRQRAVLAFRARDLAAQVAILKARIRANPDEHGPRLMLARAYYFARDFVRARMTLPLGSIIRDASCLAGEIESRLLVDEDPDAALELLEQGSEILAQGSPKVVANLRERAHNLRRHRDRGCDGEVEVSRVTQILGTSYCGSTILSLLLGQADGVCNVGESHRLIQSRTEDAAGFRDSYFDYGNPNRNVLEPEPCVSCGFPCRLFDNEFRAALQADSIDYLIRILRKSGARHLVAADKTSAYKVDPLLRFNAIVLFKTPENAWRSHLKRQRQFPEKSKYAANRTQYFDFWHHYYTDCLDNFRIRGRRLFLSFEAFLEDPVRILSRLGEELGIDVDWQGGEVQVDGQHMFGGNQELIERQAYDLERKPAPAAAETAAEPPPPFVQDLQAELLRRHRDIFG